MIGLACSVDGFPEVFLPVRFTGDGDQREVSSGAGDSERDRNRTVEGESFAVVALCEYL
jgi:hypothetical protein